MVRLVHNLVLELTEGNLTLRTMSLVYTTLLSLVPLLAVSLSLFKSFGIHNQMEPLLGHFLEPLGNKGVEFGQPILEILIKHALVCESRDEAPTYFPARDIETIRLAYIIEAIRHDKASFPAADSQEPESRQLADIMRRVDSAVDSTLEQQTVKDMVLADSFFKKD